MGWFGKLTFGTLGLLFGGPLGAIAGAALGHMLVDKKAGFTGQATRSIPGPEFGQAEQTQAAYFISLFSILGKMSKIDGVVTRDEIVVVQDFINNLPMEERERPLPGRFSTRPRTPGMPLKILQLNCTRRFKTSPPCCSPFLISCLKSQRLTANCILLKKPL